MSAVSSSFRAFCSVQSEERAISLQLKSAVSNQGSHAIKVQVGNSVRPMHIFGHTFDHDYYFELPGEGGGIPNQLLGVLLPTIVCSGLSRMRTELSQLLVIPSLAPHPVHANRQPPRHGDLGDLSSSPHRQMEILAAPFRDTAYRDVGRFHQQETQQRVALFRDVSQPSPLPAGLLQRHQPQVARDLLATLKPIRSSDDPHVRDR